MKIVFFGTPDYVLPILDKLHSNFKVKGESPITAIVTQPPKPVGRNKIITYSPVDNWAHKRGVQKYYDPKELIKSDIVADLGILASYGEIISKDVIDYFPKGILNIHFSLLPKYRGASPVHASIIAKDKECGVSIIKLDEKLDHGPIISQFKEEIRNDDTTQKLRLRLFNVTAEVLVTLLPKYVRGKITPRMQNHKKATYTRIIKKQDGFIPPKYINSALEGKSINEKWSIDFIKGYSTIPNADVIDRFVKAMNPWPIAWTKVTTDNKKNVKRLKIINTHLSGNKLIIDNIQLEGKNEVGWDQFKQGYPTFTLE